MINVAEAFLKYYKGQDRVAAILDLETTGFLKKGGKIVEVGIAGLNMDTGRVFPIFNSVCREPGMTAADRDAWIFQNSDLTVDEVRDAPFLSDLIPTIDEVFDVVLGVTAFNKSFDIPFVKDRGIKVPRELPCPMKVATPICQMPFKNGRKGNKYPSVEEAWRFFFPEDPYVELHRGLDDSMHEARIFHHMCKLGHITIKDFCTIN